MLHHAGFSSPDESSRPSSFDDDDDGSSSVDFDPNLEIGTLNEPVVLRPRNAVRPNRTLVLLVLFLYLTVFAEDPGTAPARAKRAPPSAGFSALDALLSKSTENRNISGVYRATGARVVETKREEAFAVEPLALVVFYGLNSHSLHKSVVPWNHRDDSVDHDDSYEVHLRIDAIQTKLKEKLQLLTGAVRVRPGSKTATTDTGTFFSAVQGFYVPSTGEVTLMTLARTSLRSDVSPPTSIASKNSSLPFSADRVSASGITMGVRVATTDDVVWENELVPESHERFAYHSRPRRAPSCGYAFALRLTDDGRLVGGATSPNCNHTVTLLRPTDENGPAHTLLGKGLVRVDFEPRVVVRRAHNFASAVEVTSFVEIGLLLYVRNRVGWSNLASIALFSLWAMMFSNLLMLVKLSNDGRLLTLNALEYAASEETGVLSSALIGRGIFVTVFVRIFQMAVAKSANERDENDANRYASESRFLDAYRRCELNVRGVKIDRELCVNILSLFIPTAFYLRIIGPLLSPSAAYVLHLVLGQTFWLPQIFSSAVCDEAPSYNQAFVFGLSFIHMFPYLYEWFYPFNYAQALWWAPSDDAHAESLLVVGVFFALKMCAAFVFCVLMPFAVYSQGASTAALRNSSSALDAWMLKRSLHGTRYFVWSKLLSPRYNWSRTISPEIYAKQDSCGICLDKVRPPPETTTSVEVDLENPPVVEKAVVLTPCDHLFHNECLAQWMEVKKECPFCRMRLPKL